MKPIAIIVAATFCVAVLASDSQGQAPEAPFQGIAQENGANLWVLDTRSGSARLCQPPQVLTSQPKCSPWTATP